MSTIDLQREVLGEDVKFIHYDLNITPNFSDFIFNLYETITFNLEKTTNEIILNAKDLVIEKSIVIYGGEILTPSSIKYEKETVHLLFSKELLYENDNYGIIQAHVRGEINDKMCGFYRSKYTFEESEKFAGTTQFESHDARRAFLCADEPGKKSTFSVTLNVEKELTALSNTPVVSEIDCDWNSDLKSIRFDKTPIMSTYLLAWYIGELEYVETTCKQPKTQNDIIIRTYTTPGKKDNAIYANNYAAKVLEYFAEYFDIDYPLEKLDQIAVPDFSAGAMENWGLVTYRETYILSSDTTSSYMKMQIAETISHELAHQWFGNLVTPLWWNDLWLKEGFATYISIMAVNHFDPEWKSWEYFVSTYCEGALSLDELSSSHPINNNVSRVEDVDEIFDTISYLKGASMLRMLAQWLGPDVFRQGLRTYLKEFKYENAVTDDLWKHLSNSSGMSVKELMDSWINVQGYPLVKVCKENDKYNLTQLDYGNKLSGNNWNIPLSIILQNGDHMKLIMNDNTMNLDLKDSNLLTINNERIGFFRTVYSNEMDSHFMKLIEEKGLNVFNRAEIFSTLFDLSKEGYHKTSRSLNIIHAYKDEEYLVWNSIISRLNSLKFVWKNNDLVKIGIEDFYKKSLKKYVTELGWNPNECDTYQTIKMRNLVISTLAGIGEEKTLEKCRFYFSEFIKSIRNGDNDFKINSDIRFSVFASVVRFSENNNEVTQLIDIFNLVNSAEIKVEILKAIGCTRDKETLIKSLEFAFKSNIVRAQDNDYVLLNVDNGMVKHAWEYLCSNWDLIKKLGNGIGKWTVCSILRTTILPEEQEYICKFLDNHEEDIKNIRNSIKQCIERNAKLYEWYQRDNDDVIEWFKK